MSDNLTNNDATNYGNNETINEPKNGTISDNFDVLPIIKNDSISHTENDTINEELPQINSLNGKTRKTVDIPETLFQDISKYLSNSGISFNQFANNAFFKFLNPEPKGITQKDYQEVLDLGVKFKTQFEEKEKELEEIKTLTTEITKNFETLKKLLMDNSWFSEKELNEVLNKK